ncbi:hypothetical protein TNCV_4560321 [Trichonephila clavipes]|nr:hypothetical protein TNCV_4560321 [Trichonephila clavipes]
MLPSPVISRTRTSAQEPNNAEAVKAWNNVSIAEPVPSREDLIINIYSPLQSGCGEKFIYMAGIAMIAVSPYSGSECVKRHRALPMKVHVSSTH